MHRSWKLTPFYSYSIVKYYSETSSLTFLATLDTCSASFFTLFFTGDGCYLILRSVLDVNYSSSCLIDSWNLCLASGPGLSMPLERNFCSRRQSYNRISLPVSCFFADFYSFELSACFILLRSHEFSYAVATAVLKTVSRTRFELLWTRSISFMFIRAEKLLVLEACILRTLISLLLLSTIYVLYPPVNF